MARLLLATMPLSRSAPTAASCAAEGVAARLPDGATNGATDMAVKRSLGCGLECQGTMLSQRERRTVCASLHIGGKAVRGATQRVELELQ